VDEREYKNPVPCTGGNGRVSKKTAAKKGEKRGLPEKAH